MFSVNKLEEFLPRISLSLSVYLLKKGINPEKILLLSFTRKTVSDLEKRLHKIDSRLNAYTFHKLGKDITGKDYNDSITVKNTIRAILFSSVRTFHFAYCTFFYFFPFFSSLYQLLPSMHSLFY